MHPRERLRNVAIIAHVDHGKTTLVDAMMKQSGVFRPQEAVQDRVMDSGDLERERGITILAKQASLVWEGTRINLIDTPGHADFGGEVERTLRMADGALLLVDAAEGPLPQTRFVLSKALPLGMPVIVVVNKVDRSDARPDEVLNETFDLFCALEADEKQLDFPTLYAVGRDGHAGLAPDALEENLTPLFKALVSNVPAPEDLSAEPAQLLIHNVEHDEFVGRLGVGRIWRGSIRVGEDVMCITADGSTKHRVTSLWSYEGAKRTRVEAGASGDIVAISGIEHLNIGDTLASVAQPEALPRIEVEEPTIRVRFAVNTSPLSGRSGKYVTSRQLRDRLELEAKRNLALRFFETDEAEVFEIAARGELMIAVLAETLRREGYEFALAMPEVLEREVDGQRCEPIERVYADVPEEMVGTATRMFGERRGQLVGMTPLGGGRSRVELVVPARGLIGFRSSFLSATRGTGLLNTTFDGWQPIGAKVARRPNGAIVSDRAGVATPYALFNAQPRGELFVTAGTEVYEGMVVGEHSRAQDLDINITREKKLTNVRAAGKDDNVTLSPPRKMSLDLALEFIDEDELLEVTPDALRIRKRILQCNRRPKRPGI